MKDLELFTLSEGYLFERKQELLLSAILYLS